MLGLGGGCVVDDGGGGGRVDGWQVVGWLGLKGGCVGLVCSLLVSYTCMLT